MYWISASQNMPPSFLSGRILMHQTDRILEFGELGIYLSKLGLPILVAFVHPGMYHIEACRCLLDLALHCGFELCQ